MNKHNKDLVLIIKWIALWFSLHFIELNRTKLNMAIAQLLRILATIILSNLLTLMKHALILKFSVFICTIYWNKSLYKGRWYVHILNLIINKFSFSRILNHPYQDICKMYENLYMHSVDKNSRKLYFCISSAYFLS